MYVQYDEIIIRFGTKLRFKAIDLTSRDLFEPFFIPIFVTWDVGNKILTRQNA